MNAHFWTTEEMNILKECGSYMTNKELSKILPNRSITAIQNKKHKNGITQTHNRWRQTRKVYGVGINDIGCKGENVPYYTRWVEMLKRCYSEKWHKKEPTYKDCYVCEEWVTFSNFKKWMEQQNWQGKELDKDILVPENKEYGPRTCIFVSKNLNQILKDKESCRGKYPRGVCRIAGGVNFFYQALISTYGNHQYLGSYKTVEEASKVYKKAKYEYILEWEKNLTSEDTSDIEQTKEALIRHAELFLE